MKNTSALFSAVTIFFGILAGTATAEVPTVIFDTDLALPSMPAGDGAGTPVCIHEASGLLVAGCIGAVGPQGEKGDKGDKGDTGDTGPQGPAGVIADDSVTSAHIVNGTIVGGKGGDIKAGTISWPELATDSVMADEIAPNAVGSSELAENVEFGTTGTPGSVSLRDSSDAETILLDGETGRIKFGSVEYIEDGGPALISTGTNKIETAGYWYNTAKTGHLFVPGSAFTSPQGLSDWIVSSLTQTYVSGDAAPYRASARAPVYLPDSATITKLDCFVADKSTGYGVIGKVSLAFKGSNTFTPTELGTVELNTTLAENNTNPILKSLSLSPTHVVSTINNAYSLTLTLEQPNFATSLVNFQGCRITYTITKLDP